VHVRAAVEQDPSRFLVLREDSEVQRREAVLAERLRLRRLVIEDPPERVVAAERGGLEDGQLVVRRQQIARLLDLARIESFECFAQRSILSPRTS
jgi:hypothetical protein